ncbi:hypothetical protein [Algicella marina]|uniref:XRE family transcriptional regulator n=1 Tax=Algicella marina TaxID=2683284 RepID=A0A6P1SWG2_9RHOB|nr:hypothetical protein [Algicella marina]QHQ33683.1 hypothetical protein GO499_00075 [Algicella marina]
MYQELAKNLRFEIQALCEARAISLGQIAATLEVSSAGFNELEASDRMIRCDELMSISHVLGIPLLRLFGAPEREKS